MHPFTTITRAAALALTGAAGLMLGAAGPATAAQTGMTSVPVSYTCNLSSYGQNLAPLTVSASISASSSVMAGSPITVTVVTASTALPSTTAANLPAISYLSMTGDATLSGSGNAAALTGKSQYLGAAAGAMSQLPALTATGTVAPQTGGTVSVAAPSAIRLVPSDAGGAMTPVVCTAASTVSVKVTVLTSSAGGTGTSATPGTQPYSCTTGTQAMTIPMRLSYSGPNSMASTDQVSLTSASPLTSMADDTPMSASAALGLSGASSGAIPLSLGMPQGRLALTAAWQPQRAGLFRLMAPHRFQFRVRQTTSVTVVIVCTATTTTTTTTTVRVAASSMSSTAAQGIAAAEGSSTSAPDTGAGGSLHSPVNMALLAVGALAAAAGAITIVLAIRRRTGGTLTP